MSFDFEEQRAQIRKVRYTAGSVVTLLGPALGAALLQGGADKWVALIVAILGIVGGSATNAMAATKVGKQINDGQFSPPPPVDPVQMVTDVMNQIANEAAAKVNNLNAVTQVAATVLPGLAIGGVGAIANGVSAVEAAINEARDHLK